jgi:predicted transglutaminase-like protease
MLKQTADNIAKYYAELTKLINDDFKKISDFKGVIEGQKTLNDIAPKVNKGMLDQAQLTEKLTQLRSKEAIEIKKQAFMMAFRSKRAKQRLLR